MNNLNKQQRDNRANQMNPNNIAYYKSRMGGTTKKQNSGNYNQQKKSTKNNYMTNNKNIKVVHVHQPKNEGYCCPICGKPGGLHSTMFGSMKCSHCGSRFSKSEVKK